MRDRSPRRPARPHVAVMLLALGAAGCDERAVLSTEGLQGVLLAELGDVTRVVALDPVAEPLIERPAPEGALYALGYEASLASMGFVPGDVELSADGGPLPPADRTLRLDGASFTALDARPPALDALRVKVNEPCAAFSWQTRSFEVESADFATYAVHLDAARVLVATLAQRRFVLTSTSIELREDLDLPTAAGSDRGDEAWLAGPGRRVVHGNRERGFVAAPELPFDLGLAGHIATSPPSAPLEVFVASSDLEVAHFDGTAWRRIRAPTPVTARTRAGIAWAEPGVAVLLGRSESSVVELTADGAETAIELQLPPRTQVPDSLWALGRSERYGPIASTRYSVTFHRSALGWERWPVPDASPTAEIVLDMGSSVFVGGQQGVLIEFRSDGRPCAAFAGPQFTRIGAIAALGREFVAVGDLEGVQLVAAIAHRE